jgi:methionyl-tRNA formyltransferase
LDNKDYLINWSWSAEKIKRFVDAVGYPYDGAKTFLDGVIINFVDVEVVDDVFIENRNRHLGKIIFMKNKFPIAVCQKGLLKLVDIRDDENKAIEVKFRSRFN